MAKTEREFVIPLEMQPEAGMLEIRNKKGERILLRNDAMFTGVQHSAAEFSEFFIAIRDECRLFGHRCPSCGHIICPPYQRRCPPCGFAELEKETLRDFGAMIASPVITMFPPARFKKEVPFTRGRVILFHQNGMCDTAMMVECRTTTGIMRPGVFEKGTLAKVVFRDTRVGSPLDLFVVPASELSEEQLSQSPLMESDINWDDVREPALTLTKDAERLLGKIMQEMKELSRRISQSERAQADLARWQCKVRVKTQGGDFLVGINDGRLRVFAGTEEDADLVWAVENPALLSDWLAGNVALTNCVAEGTLWMNKSDMETVTRLDRVIRSLRRDNA